MRRRPLIAILVAMVLMLPIGLRAQETPPLVFAAASLKNALDDIAFKSGVEVITSYAASSALAKQIEQGAEASLFFSADLDWMEYLDEKKLIASATRTNLLKNRIVLVAPADAAQAEIAIGPDLDLAAQLDDGRLAVADVGAVPAGKYGKAALEKLGAWAGVEGKLAQAENVRAALALVALGEAPLGIVYATDAAAERKVKIVGTFPEDSHPPIIYPVALTASGADQPKAAAFLSYLKGSEAAAAFRRQGFTVLGQPGS